VPSQAQRGDILRAILCEIDHSLSETQIEELASITHGFVGADLVGLRDWAASICLRRYAEQKLKKTCNASSDDITEQPTPLKSATNSRYHSGIITSSVSDMSVASSLLLPSFLMGETSEIIDETPDHGEEEHILKVTFEDFQKARPEIRPSAMREVRLMA